LWRLFAHNHWLNIKIFGREIRLCARCTGYLSSYFLCRCLFLIIPCLHIFYKLRITEQLTLCSLLIVPFALDWITQSWNLRKSNNLIRFLTGTSLGISVSLLRLIPSTMKFSLYISLGFIIMIIGLLGKICPLHRRREELRYDDCRSSSS